MSDIKLIVGLGNPGMRYAATRHNMGAMLVERLAEQHQVNLQIQTKLQGRSSEIIVASEKIRLFVPTTYMNESGRALQAVMHYYKLKPAHVVIAHDDLDLAVGQVKLKKGGGHGGHNGLRDILSQLATQDFYRLRLGIGHPGHKHHVTPYVLAEPNADEKISLQRAIDCIIALMPELVQGQMATVMQQLHTTCH